MGGVLVIYFWVTNYSQTEVAWSNKHSLCHRLCESVIPSSLAGRSQFTVLDKVVIKVLARSAVISKLRCRKIHFRAHFCGCWKVSDPLLSSLMTLQLASPRASNIKEQNKNSPGGWKVEVNILPSKKMMHLLPKGNPKSHAYFV